MEGNDEQKETPNGRSEVLSLPFGTETKRKKSESRNQEVESSYFRF
jgi:hypothetical protein